MGCVIFEEDFVVSKMIKGKGSLYLWVEWLLLELFWVVGFEVG